MEKLNLKEGIYLHVVTSLSSLDFGTCLILCSFSWLKWFKSNYDILRVDSAHVWDIERVAQFWPTPQLVDGIWMEDCTTASWQQQHATVAVSRKTFFTAGMLLSQTQWGSFERATQSTHGHLPMPCHPACLYLIRSWLSSSGKVFTSSWRAWNHLDKESPTEIWDILRPCIFLDQWWSMMVRIGGYYSQNSQTL
jgi:hypothetical protein